MVGEMMDAHRRLVDVWLQRIVRIRQRRERKILRERARGEHEAESETHESPPTD